MAIKTLTNNPDTFNDDDFGNTIYGLAGNDTIRGMGGNDTIDGGTGADTMYGGLGDDSYIVDNVNDVVLEIWYHDANEGIDTVFASVSYALNGTTIEKLVLTGSAYEATGSFRDNTLKGTDLANRLSGGAGSDIIYGGGGSDIISGGTGADLAYGGLGDDTFYVDSAFDRVFENLGQGTDLVVASTSYSLAATPYIEKLKLSGSATVGSGNALANTITGNTLANTLYGEAGADSLDGGDGDDQLYGGARHLHRGQRDGPGLVLRTCFRRRRGLSLRSIAQ